jgi:hypothetical protein
VIIPCRQATHCGTPSIEMIDQIHGHTDQYKGSNFAADSIIANHIEDDHSDSVRDRNPLYIPVPLEWIQVTEIHFFSFEETAKNS